MAKKGWNKRRRKKTLKRRKIERKRWRHSPSVLLLLLLD